MFVLFSKIFAFVLAAIAISKSYVDFKSRKESLKIFLFWLFTWLVIVVVALFPSIVDYIIGPLEVAPGSARFWNGPGFPLFLAYQFTSRSAAWNEVNETVQELALRELDKPRIEQFNERNNKRFVRPFVKFVAD